MAKPIRQITKIATKVLLSVLPMCFDHIEHLVKASSDNTRVNSISLSNLTRNVGPVFFPLHELNETRNIVLESIGLSVLLVATCTCLCSISIICDYVSAQINVQINR